MIRSHCRHNYQFYLIFINSCIIYCIQSRSVCKIRSRFISRSYSSFFYSSSCTYPFVICINHFCQIIICQNFFRYIRPRSQYSYFHLFTSVIIFFIYNSLQKFNFPDCHIILEYNRYFIN